MTSQKSILNPVSVLLLVVLGLVALLGNTDRNAGDSRLSGSGGAGIRNVEARVIVSTNVLQAAS